VAAFPVGFGDRHDLLVARPRAPRVAGDRDGHQERLKDVESLVQVRGLRRECLFVGHDRGRHVAAPQREMASGVAEPAEAVGVAQLFRERLALDQQRPAGVEIALNDGQLAVEQQRPGAIHARFPRLGQGPVEPAPALAEPAGRPPVEAPGAHGHP